MIFLGDIACPDNRIEEFLECVNREKCFQNEVVIYNLEGNILEDDVMKCEALHNSPSIVHSFENAKKVIVSLANNHMYDYPERIAQTQETLENHGIGYFGLYSEDGRILPYEYYDSTTDTIYAFFGHCWRLYTETNRNTVNDIRVVDCDYDVFCKNVSEYIANNPNTKVYCMMHWNYDMEILPFPMLRSVSKKLIDCGVEAVIGSHSHVPQGIEYYKGKLIAYCLGNFYIPSGFFFNGTLVYPEISKTSYAVQFEERDRKAKCIWYSTDTDIPICFFEESQVDRMEELSKGFNLIDTDYKTYFKKKRAKSLMVPLFIRDSGALHKFEEHWAITRIKLIKAIKK